MQVENWIQMSILVQFHPNRSKSTIFTDFCDFRNYENNFTSKNVFSGKIKGGEFDFNIYFTLLYADRYRIDRIYRFLPIFVIFLIE